jgi:hypothetical protein
MGTEIQKKGEATMRYVKPEILKTCAAQKAIKGSAGKIGDQYPDSMPPHVDNFATPAAYEADE